MPDKIKLNAASYRNHGNVLVLHVEAPDHDLTEIPTPGIEVADDGTARFEFVPAETDDDGKPVKTAKQHEEDCAREAALLLRHHIERASGKGRKLKSEGAAL